MTTVFARNKQGKNQHGGAGGGLRDTRVFGWKPPVKIAAVIEQECEAEGLTRTQWIDRAVEFYLSQRSD